MAPKRTRETPEHVEQPKKQKLNPTPKPKKSPAKVSNKGNLCQTFIKHRRCCAPGCTSFSVHNPSLSFFKFPSDNGSKMTILNDRNEPVEVDRREEWHRRLHVPSDANCRNLSVCLLHFAPKDVCIQVISRENRIRRLLRKKAAPSLLLPPPLKADLSSRIPVVRLLDFRKQVTSPCNLRSAEELLDTILPKDANEDHDLPSEDEEDGEFYQPEWESEEEADDDPEFETPVASPAERYSDDALGSDDETKGNKSGSSKRKRQSSRPVTEDPGSERRIIRGKNGYRWYATPERPGERQPPTAEEFTVGLRKQAASAKNPFQAWRVLMDDKILDQLILHTNGQIKLYCKSQGAKIIDRETCSAASRVEMNALIGLLYFFGLQKTANSNLEDLWSDEFGSTLYRAAMPLKRFKFLLSMLRFDNPATRSERKKIDGFAPIRDVWDAFLSNCQTNYSPHGVCTIDEQLLGFRGRCPFKTRMPGKLDELGVKIVTMNDAKTLYMCNAVAPVGREKTDNREAEPPSYYIRELSRPIRGTWRTIVADKWFTSVEIVRQTREEFALTMVGGIRKSEREVPERFERAGAVGSARFAFDDTKTLVSYTPRSDRVVLVLSSLHAADEINEESGEPEIVRTYNSAKDAGQQFNRLCREYSTARIRTQRWATRVWLGMLDQAAVNAMIVYNSIANNEKMTHREFLKSLIMNLLEPQLRARQTLLTLPVNLQRLVARVPCKVPKLEESRNDIRRACYQCSQAKKLRVRYVRGSCDGCLRPICREHRTQRCMSCSV